MGAGATWVHAAEMASQSKKLYLVVTDNADYYGVEFCVAGIFDDKAEAEKLYNEIEEEAYKTKKPPYPQEIVELELNKRYKFDEKYIGGYEE